MGRALSRNGGRPRNAAAGPRHINLMLEVTRFMVQFAQTASSGDVEQPRLTIRPEGGRSNKKTVA